MAATVDLFGWPVAELTAVGVDDRGDLVVSLACGHQLKWVVPVSLPVMGGLVRCHGCAAERGVIPTLPPTRSVEQPALGVLADGR